MKVFMMEQYSEDWWTARRGVPTASEFHRIITPKTGAASSQWPSYICSLIGEIYDPSYPRQNGNATSAMKRGSALEPDARRFYEFDTGGKVQQVGFCLDDAGHFGCSPDALVGEDGGLESKSPNPETHVGYILGRKLPDDYAPQVHGCLAVTGRAWWDFMSYCPGFQTFRVRVTPNDYTGRLKNLMSDFWDLYCKTLAAFRE